MKINRHYLLAEVKLKWFNSESEPRLCEEGRQGGPTLRLVQVQCQHLSVGFLKDLSSNFTCVWGIIPILKQDK